MQRPLLSIIIVSWNVRDFLAGCLESLARDGLFDWSEVIVVDNLSGDGTVEMVRNRFPMVKVLEPGVNLGYSRGNNLGLSCANGDFVLLLNPDTVVLPGSLRNLVDFATAHREYGALGPKQFDGQGKIRYDGATELPTQANILCDLAMLSDAFPHAPILPNRKMTYWDHEGDREVPAVPGSAMLLRRDVLERVGMLDETMFIIEDMDMCRRVTAAGWRIFYLGSAPIIHYGGQSLSKGGDRDSYIQIAFQSYWLYLRKHEGRFAAGRMTALFMGASCVAFLLLTVARAIGIRAGAAHRKVVTAILQWTLRDKEAFHHDLAAPATPAKRSQATAL